MEKVAPEEDSPSSLSMRWPARVGWLCLGGVIALCVVWLLARGGVKREAALMAGIFVFAALLWVSEAIPLFATALAVILLECLLLANPAGLPFLGFESARPPSVREVFTGAADPVLLLFFGGFVLAGIASKEGVDRAVSVWLLRPFTRSRPLLLLGVLSTTALFSMWMSNTATATMMLALLIPILRQIPPSDSFRKALLLAVPFGANIGGIGTPVGTPPNALALGFLQRANINISFLDWMLMAVPLMLLVIAIAAGVLLFLFGQRGGGHVHLAASELGGRGRFVIAVFGLTVAAWITTPWHGVPASLVALTPVVFFAMSGFLSAADVNRIPWDILVLLAGGIALAAGMEKSSLDKLIVQSLPSSALTLKWLMPSMAILTLVMSVFMSNTAVTNLLLPIGISAAQAVSAASAAPLQVAVAIALSGSLAMVLPVSTPPNAIAYGAGGILLRDMVKSGVAIATIGCALLLLYMPLLARFAR